MGYYYLTICLVIGVSMSDKMIPQISNIEMMIMSILLEKAGAEIYGWELMEASDGKLKRGTIYVILNRMEDKGFIESRKEERRVGARGLPRRMYKLTGMGQHTLSVWKVAQEQFSEGVLI